MNTNLYIELKEKHQKEVNEFPMVFAFNKEQFGEGLKKLGLEPSDTDKIYILSNCGGFIRKTDCKAFNEMFERHSNEMSCAIVNDSTGDGFIFDMFYYELANHEYSYTMDLSDTLEALGLTKEKINNSPNLLHGLQKARKNIMNQ